MTTHTMNTTAKTTSTKKQWLLVTLAAAALTLSACGKKDEAPMETEPTADAQATVEPSDTAMATDDTAMATDEHAGMTADEHAGMTDDDMMNDEMTDDDMMNDDVATASADDSEMMDGTETEESTSTN